DEMERLAVRLESAATGLAATGVGQADLLGAAEAAAALPRVLAAGAVADPEAGALLDAAARGLRAALADGTVIARGERVRLLDNWLR
ncbi:MAG: hypothetical protein ABI838_09890, partial [Chloroflexota bacterium]